MERATTRPPEIIITGHPCPNCNRRKSIKVCSEATPQYQLKCRFCGEQWQLKKME